MPAGDGIGLILLGNRGLLLPCTKGVITYLSLAFDSVYLFLFFSNKHQLQHCLY
jgi:hypothetical protein